MADPTHTNTVVEYAIDHEQEAKRILLGAFRVPPDDLEDVLQDVYLSLLRASKGRTVEFPIAYWWAALRSAVKDYLRRCKVRSIMCPLTIDCADALQDPETLAIQRQQLREALAMVRPGEREAVRDYVLGRRKSGRVRTAMHRLRRRLRVA